MLVRIITCRLVLVLMSLSVGAAAAQVFLTRTIGLGAREVAKAVLPSLVVAAMALAPAAALSMWLSFSGPAHLATAAVAGVLTVIAWGLALRGAQHPAWPELMRLAESLAAKLRRRPASS